MTKSQLRRHGLQKVVNDPIEHRNVLAVHYVSKKPGLESVVKALARFRQLAMKSCRQPTLVFKEAPWDGWKRKKQLTHSAGTFWWYAKTLRIPNEKQHHVKIHVETQYIIPFSTDLWYITKCAPRKSNGEKRTQKQTCYHGPSTNSTSTDNFFERHQVWNELHQTSPFYRSKTLFFLKFNEPEWRPIGEPTPPGVMFIY